MLKKILLIVGFLGLLHAQAAKITLENNVIEEGTGRGMVFNATYEGVKAWAGIYKVGTSNEWKNVQSWSWVEDKTIIDLDNLSAGEYELRLFFNNSYKMEAKTSLTVTP